MASQPMAAYQSGQGADADPILLCQFWSKTGPSSIVGKELVDLLGREAVHQVALRSRVDARPLRRCWELQSARSSIGASAQVGGRTPVQPLPAEAHQEVFTFQQAPCSHLGLTVWPCPRERARPELFAG